MIKLLLEIKSSFLSRKIRFFLKVWALKVDINLLNQHCQPADWMDEWLTDLLRHFCTKGTQGTGALEGYLGTQDTWGTWALKWHLGTRTLKALGHLKHSDIRRALGHSRYFGTWAIRHLGTRALKALEALYLEDSGRSWSWLRHSHLFFFQGSAHRELTLNICQSFVEMSMEWNKRFHQRYFIELSLVSLLSNRPIYNVFQLYLSSWYLANGWLAWPRSGIPWAVIKSSK